MLGGDIEDDVCAGEGQSKLELGDPEDIDIGQLEKVRREESVDEG